MPETITCHCCGKTLPADNLAWNFAWPDPIAELSGAERKRTLKFSSDAFLFSREHGAAVRVILPIGLENGRRSTHMGLGSIDIAPRGFRCVWHAKVSGVRGLSRSGIVQSWLDRHRQEQPRARVEGANVASTCTKRDAPLK